jgi:hypothetical protein
MLKQYSYMRSPVLRRKLALAAALIAGAGAPPALAQTQYTFGTSAGSGAYCDGLLLTQSGRLYTGIHNSPTNTCTEGDNAGGFWARHYGTGAGGDGVVVSPTTRLITITTEEASLPGDVEVFNIDVIGQTWNVWLEGPGPQNFALINGGVLLTPLEAETARRGAQKAGGEARHHAALNRPAVFK